LNTSDNLRDFGNYLISKEPFKLLAPSKVNLSLKVVGRNPNGYHELDMIVAPCSLSDVIEITFTKKETSSVVIEFSRIFKSAQLLKHNSQLSDTNKNLATKAFLSFAEVLGLTGINVDILITKNIPIGGGLGGGSADAAAVLKLMVKLYNDYNVANDKIFKDVDLSQIALNLGADVPVLITNKWARVQGIGEKITFIDPLIDPSTQIAIIWPRISLATKDVFDRYTFDSHSSLEQNSPDTTPKLFRNDLEASAVSINPIIGKLLNLLRQNNFSRYVMTGSGSCVVVVANEQDCSESFYPRLNDFLKTFSEDLVIFETNLR
jgi:4-diphosphocytidyl-2-C-methyl-D-erythritol kinase